MKTREELAKAGIDLLNERQRNAELFNNREIKYDEWAAKDASLSKKIAGWRRSYISYTSKSTGIPYNDVSIIYGTTITEWIIIGMQDNI